jgi:CubicO group peptidase (beta-lactamase class C family)
MKNGIYMKIYLFVIVFYLPACGTALSQPEVLDDGWQVSTLSAVGINSLMIAKVTEGIEIGRFRGIHSYLIVKNGKLVYEYYVNGYSGDDLQTVFSITKSVTSTLIGIAIDREDISGVRMTLPELLPEFSEAIIATRARKITLEHLLTLTSGFEWDEKTYGYGDRRNSERRMVNDDNWIAHVLGLPVKDNPGSRYVYNTGSVHMISAVIKTQTGFFADEYARRFLFQPLGIVKFDWNTDPQGYPCTGGTHGGLRMRARDLAKFGFLFLNEGRWQERQVVPRDWVIRATTGQVEAHPPFQVGYLWWTGEYKLKGHTLRHFYGAGYGGQSISMIPELDLMVVFTAWSRPDEANIIGPLFMTISAALDD